MIPPKQIHEINKIIYTLFVKLIAKKDISH
jgi:hypothetical protein